MITLGSIKILLTTAGISRLKIDFDDEHKHVNAEYVFRGVPGTKQITYQEIIESLTIGLTRQPVGPVMDVDQELK